MVGDIYSEKSDQEITAQTKGTSDFISTRNRAGKEALVVSFIALLFLIAFDMSQLRISFNSNVYMTLIKEFAFFYLSTLISDKSGRQVLGSYYCLTRILNFKLFKFLFQQAKSLIYG